MCSEDWLGVDRCCQLQVRGTASGPPMCSSMQSLRLFCNIAKATLAHIHWHRLLISHTFSSAVVFITAVDFGGAVRHLCQRWLWSVCRRYECVPPCTCKRVSGSHASTKKARGEIPACPSIRGRQTHPARCLYWVHRPLAKVKTKLTTPHSPVRSRAYHR